MTTSLALVVFAAAVAVLGPSTLRRSPWTRRSPHMGIAAWQALSASVVLAVVLAGVALTVPALASAGDLVELVRVCLMALRIGYSAPGGLIASGFGAAAAAAVLVRVFYCLVRELLQAGRKQRRQWRALAAVGYQHMQYDAMVIDHSSAAAYCLPGRGSRIVITSGAVSVLNEVQLESVLAHERAHQRGHHHLLLAVADALQRAFPIVPAFRDARVAMGPLVEMLADDAAARRSSRLTVATALVRLSESTGTPQAALGVGGESALLRVHRLTAPPHPLGAGRTLLVAWGAVFLLATPLVMAIAPASAALSMPPCPPTSMIEA